MTEAARPRVGAEERTSLLLDLLAEGKRVLDHQVQAMEQLDTKTQQTLALAAAALAGALALATFAAERVAGRVGVAFLVLVAAAALLNLVALGVLLAAYVGFRRHAELAVGPSLDWLGSKATDETWTRQELLVNLLLALPGYAAFNAEGMRRAAEGRRVGLYLLGTAAILYVGLGIYLLQRTVLP